MNRKQNGQTLIIVLIILAVGSLLIVPTLNYVSTGLLGIRVAKNSLLTQYALDAAAEYQLWQLDYSDNVTELLEQPDETITVNGIDVEVGLEVPPPPELPDPPIVVSGKGLQISLESSPSWISLGYEGNITYTIKFYNCGTATMVASYAQTILPIGFEYVENSWETDLQDEYGEPPTIVATAEPYNPDQHQVVEFTLSGAATTRKIPTGTVGETAPYKWIKFEATTNIDAGIFTAGAAGITDKGTNEIDDGALVWSSIYYTKPHAGQDSSSLVIKVNSDGSVEVISYQTQ